MNKKNLKEVNLDAFSEMMAKESDRACALLGAALLDAKLESIFRQSLKSYEKELLDNFSSPLSTFSARIVLARALNWIDDATYHDLNKVRSIRNEFAHSFDHELSFDNQSISDRCSMLKIVQAYLDGFDQMKNSPEKTLQFSLALINDFKKTKENYQSARKRYELTTHFLSQYLDDIPTKMPEYGGSNILEEVYSLSANTVSKMSVTIIGYVGQPEENATNIVG